MPSHRARRRGPPRVLLVLAASCAVVGLVVAGRLIASTPEASARPAAHTSEQTTPATPTRARSPSAPASHSPHPRSSTRPSPSASPRTHSTPSPRSSPTRTRRASGSANARAEAAVLAQINRARSQAGLPAYTRTAGLQISAGRHNARMAAGCGLSHQCPGEAAIGDRETAAGVHWSAAGENIGEGGPVAVGSITAMAQTLTRDMLNEKPPDDGHRLNLLSKTFTHIGIVVYRDSHGVVWMTQDFSN
jgi:uncharacterized protein YkwD